jgi:Secretion system C-terminal sorting domain
VGSWVSYDIPLSNFTNMTARAHLAQLIFVGSNSKVYVDNIYFYNANSLPIELTNFKAKLQNNTTVLNWQTASESNNKAFEIERSNDGVDFKMIGTIKGNGTTNVVHNYYFADKNPINGINYYRLRQLDFDDKATISRVVSVVFGKNILILKNTLVHDVLDVTVAEDQKGPLSIFNVSGQLMYSTTIQGNQLLNLSALSSGMYIVRTLEGEVRRFVKD